MALQFCKHEDVVFDHAPLVRVLCQIRFPPVLSLLTVAGVTGFQAGIREHYPTLLPAEPNAFIQVSRDQVGVETQPPVWRFVDQERQWTVGLAANFVSLETPTYTHIDEFLERFQHVLSVLHRTIRPATSLRIGMRKVNIIEVHGRDSSSLTGAVRRELLGPISVEGFPALISGYFSQLVFEEEYNQLVVRHGLAAEDEDSDQESLRFVIDLDYFTERPYDVDGTDSLVDLLRHFSDGMTSFFHWSVEDDYKTNLGPRARQEARGDQ